MDVQKFGSFLQSQRRTLGMTQQQLAETLHVTDKAVSRWERGVGLPDINLLEPLADALDLSLTELIRSEKMESETLTRDAADAAVAETLALAQKRRQKALSCLCSFLVWSVEMFFIGVITWFVDVMPVRLAALMMVFLCGQWVKGLAEVFLYPEKSPGALKRTAKSSLLYFGLTAFLLIFALQPYIGLENCGKLALFWAVLLLAWGCWELGKHVKSMPDSGAPGDE